MLRYANKKVKEKLLAQFKNDALNYIQKKKYEKYKRIQEENDYFLKQEKQNNDFQKINKEIRRRKEQQFNEYNLMLTKLNYKKPVYILKSNTNTSTERPSIKYNLKELDEDKNFQRKERDFILRKDIIGKYLTDENNTEELIQDLKREKERNQKYQKEINDLQYLEYQKNNADLYGTIDPLIVKRAKRKYLTENPYSFIYRYDFWKSNLSHNPITNPENDFNYNKYIFKDNPINFTNKINENENKNKYNNSIDTNHFRKIKLKKNYKTNGENVNNNIYNNHKSTIVPTSSRYQMDLKRRFFNLSNDFSNANNNNYNEELSYNNNIYSPKIQKRKILRQAISSSFLN
jgi:hypothetical protein